MIPASILTAVVAVVCKKVMDTVFDDEPSKTTYDVIKEPISTGNLGESYTPMMHFMPTSNRVSMDVTKGYDAMIFVYKANPSEILPRDN